MSVKTLKAGKHSCVGHLSAGAAAEAQAGQLDRPVMMVYVGEFDSMDGPVEITEEIIDRLVTNHNARLDRLRGTVQSDEALVPRCPPLQLDHSTSAEVTVGRVLGKLFKGEHVNEDGKTVPALMCERIRVLGAENVAKVADGRWSNVSIGADLETGELNELSITPFPAAPRATILKRMGESDTTSSQEGDSMHEKLKKHLMEAKQMSAEQADEHLGKMRDHLKKHLGMDDEAADKHLAAMEAEHADKLGAAMSEAHKLADDVKEEEKKLAAAKTEIVKLSKGLSAGLKETRLAARQSSIRSRLAKLQASAKITPAERKKHDLKRLAALEDAALEEVLKTYESREPVIDARVHGTSRAVNLSKLQKDAERARLTAETKKDMGIQLSAAEEKSLAEKGERPMQPEGVPGAQDGSEHMKHLEMLLGDHPHKEAIMAHVAKMVGTPEEMSEGTEEEHKQLSGLVENVNKLHTQYSGLVKLFGDATGLSAAELTE